MCSIILSDERYNAKLDIHGEEMDLIIIFISILGRLRCSFEISRGACLVFSSASLGGICEFAGHYSGYVECHGYDKVYPSKVHSEVGII